MFPLLDVEGKRRRQAYRDMAMVLAMIILIESREEDFPEDVEADPSDLSMWYRLRRWLGDADDNIAIHDGSDPQTMRRQEIALLMMQFALCRS